MVSEIYSSVFVILIEFNIYLGILTNLVIIENDQVSNPLSQFISEPLFKTKYLSLLNEKVIHPIMSTERDPPIGYWANIYQQPIIDSKKINESSMLISITDLSSVNNLKFLGKALNLINSAEIYVDKVGK